MEEKVIDYVVQLFKGFGYWSIALVGATTLFMIPVNLLIKKLFSKATSDSVIRVRKTLSQSLVFVFSGLFILLFCVIFEKPLDVNFITINAIPCGGISMVLWGIIKVVRDLGFKPLLKLFVSSNSFKKMLKNVPLDAQVKTTVFNALSNLVKDADGKNAEVVISKSLELTARATQMLNGFVSNPKEIAVQLVEVLQKKYSK
jgi:hypothetical protein